MRYPCSRVCRGTNDREAACTLFHNTPVHNIGWIFHMTDKKTDIYTYEKEAIGKL